MIGTSSWILRCTRRFSRNSNVLISSSLIGATTSASSSWGMTCLQAKSQPILGGVRTKMSERALRRKKLRKMKTGTENVPLLKDTMRKLYMRTHPDLFGQYPTQQQINEESYKELLGILDSIEKNNEFPSAKKLQLPFYLKTPVEGQFKKVSLNLRTTGGACNTLVEAALGTFFTECGLPAVFRWQEGSWGKTLGKEAVQNENLKFDKEKPVTKTFEEEENKPEHIAPAYHPVDRNAPQDHSIERILTELNDVFEIIAAVPLMDEEEYGELRRYYEEEQGLDEIEMRGYRIKEATHLIWKGERDMNVLGRGLDIDSAMIVQRILMHTLSIEQKVQEFLATDGALVDEDDKEEHQQEDSNEKEKIPH